MDYDDGYIAYLNGEEIQRSPNLVGSANAWDYTDGYLEAVLFNGIPDMVTWATDGPGSPQLVTARTSWPSRSTTPMRHPPT